MSKACPQLHVFGLWVFLGCLSWGGRLPSPGVDSWTDRLGTMGQGERLAPSARGTTVLAQKAVLPVPGVGEARAGPRRGRERPGPACHRRPLGKVLAHPPQAGVLSPFPPHGTRALSVAGAAVLITQGAMFQCPDVGGTPTRSHWRLFLKPPSTFPHWPRLVGTGVWGPCTDHTDKNRRPGEGN